MAPADTLTPAPSRRLGAAAFIFMKRHGDSRAEPTHNKKCQFIAFKTCIFLLLLLSAMFFFFGNDRFSSYPPPFTRYERTKRADREREVSFWGRPISGRSVSVRA